MSVTTPNMNLIESTVGVDSGLLWEQNLNSSLTLVDGHNHTPGYGVPIPPSGLNINSSLNFQNQQAVGLQASVYQAQTSLSVLNAVYVSGVDLYYNDGSGNVVRLTSGGTVNATSSGITSGTATASFVSGVLVVNSAANTPANIQAGSLLLGNNVSGSKFLTLSPPSAMASNFSLTLPSLPAGQQIMTLDNSGNIAAPYTVDNTSIAISSNVIGVKALGISQGDLGSLRSASSGTAGIGQVAFNNVISYTNSTTSYSAVGSVTITSTGRPIRIFLQPTQPTGFTQGGSITIGNTSGSQLVVGANIQISNGSTLLTGMVLDTLVNSGSSATFPLSSVEFTDYVSGAGTWTYNIQASAVTGSQNVTFTLFQIVAYEV